MAITPGILAVDEPATTDKRVDTNTMTRSALVVQRDVMSVGSPDDTLTENIAGVVGADPAATAMGLVVRDVRGSAVGTPKLCQITDGVDLALVTVAGAQVVDGSGVTQPISAASLPLPAGAATSALQLAAGHDVTVDNVAGTNPVPAQGNAAHDVAAAGNPVLCGAQMETMADSAPGTRAGTDGDANKLATLDGALYVIPTGPQSYQTVNLGLLTAAVVKAAPAAGLSLYVTAVTFSIGAATASSIKLISSATDIWGPHYLEAVNGRGIHATFPTPVKVAAATALTATSTGSTTATLNVYGFTAPG